MRIPIFPSALVGRFGLPQISPGHLGLFGKKAPSKSVPLSTDH
jgi:hypothetical protein